MKHCSTECSKKARRVRSRNRYADMKRYEPLLKNDQVLKRFFEEGEEIVSRKLLARFGFDESVHLKTKDGSTNPIIVMGQYGARLHNTEELKLYRIEDGDH